MKSKLIFILFVITSCKQEHKEMVYPACAGIIVDSVTGKIISEDIYDPGEIFIPNDQKLITFNLMGDTLDISGSGMLNDSSRMKYKSSIIYTFQKGNIAKIYSRYGEDYQSIFLEPESKRIIRESIFNNKLKSQSEMTSLVQDSLAKFYIKNYFILKHVSYVEWESEW